MRIAYCSDLHLEAQSFDRPLGQGDVLIIAGDLCHARALDPLASDGYAAVQRERALRFADAALRSFGQVILVPGNHDHYEGFFDETAGLLARHLGFMVLDDSYVDLGGVSVFGATLWSDFSGRDEDATRRARKGCGEFFFVRRHGPSGPVRFSPHDALTAHETTLANLRTFLAPTGRKIVVTHHAPSPLGLNAAFAELGLDGAYATDLGDLLQETGPEVWIHGHTHVRRTYKVGATDVRVNCLGFVDKDPDARSFRMATFDLR